MKPFVPIATLLAAVLLSACAAYHEETAVALKEAMGIDISPEQIGETAPKISYQAEVLLARGEGYYTTRRFAEAADEYGRFMELHATHPWAPYALYQFGMSHLKQVKSPDRDPEQVRIARQAFENLIANHPDSPAAEHARRQLVRVIDIQAEHELGVARFYIRTGHPEAAIARLIHLAETWPESSKVTEALFWRGEALKSVGRNAEAHAAFTAYLKAENTDKKLRAKARKRLEELGG